MKTNRHSPPGIFKLSAAAAMGFAATMVFVQGVAFATTAANTTISNTATVNYDDSNGTAQGAINASVDVTVNLVEATPTLNAPGDQSVSSTSSVDYSYIITSNANGVDTYDLTSTETAADAGITGNARVFRDSGDTANITSIDLGATSVDTGVTITAAGTTNVLVPSDGAADASLNGLVAGDTVVVNGAVHTVASITDNASGTSTLELNGNGADNAVTVGMQIGERGSFIFRVTPTTTVDSDTVTNQVDAQDDAAAQAAAQDSTITTVLLVPSLTVTKYVRNTTSDDSGAGVCITVDTGLGEGNVQYCDGSVTAVTGDPGDTLEYIIEVANAASAAQATDVVISDPVPAYTTYTAGSMQLDPGTGVWGALTDNADDGDGGETDSATIYIYAGSGGDDTAAGVGSGAGGSVNGGATTLGAFRVTIDN